MDGHHILRKQTLKIAVGKAAIKEKQNQELSDGERNLLSTPLTTILRDRRNIVRISRQRHHRAHQGIERLKPDELPEGIHDFAAEYGLEWALEHELGLMAKGGRT